MIFQENFDILCIIPVMTKVGVPGIWGIAHPITSAEKTAWTQVPPVPAFLCHSTRLKHGFHRAIPEPHMPDAGFCQSYWEPNCVASFPAEERSSPAVGLPPATLPTLFMGSNETFMMSQKTCFPKVGWRKPPYLMMLFQPHTHTHTVCTPAENRIDPSLAISSSCRLSQS